MKNLNEMKRTGVYFASDFEELPKQFQNGQVIKISHQNTVDSEAKQHLVMYDENDKRRFYNRKMRADRTFTEWEEEVK